MADEKILTEDDEPVIVEVEKLPTAAEIAAKETATPEEEEPSEEETEDARLVSDEDDEDDDSGAQTAEQKAKNRKTRSERRKLAKAAEQRLRGEVESLRAWKQATEARLIGMETNVLSQSEAQVDERLTKTREDISLADRILAKAIEAGNGEDAAAALRLRDEAKTAERELLLNKSSFSDVKKNAPDPKVVNLSNEWKEANATWYGADANATNIANQIDGQVAADGYRPDTPAYWQELSRRLEARFRAETPPKPNGAPKKTVPPQGQSREHVPPSTRREVYVTPERKQAMVDAGIWDDIPRRTKMLKAYADFDRDQSAS